MKSQRIASTHSLRHVRHTAARSMLRSLGIGACLVAAACSGEAPLDTAETEPPAAEPPEVPAETLIAEVQLSGTHRIEFVETPSGAVGVRESMDPELDDVESSLAAAGINASTPLDEIYVIAATDRVDWDVADRLHAVQERIDAADAIVVPELVAAALSEEEAPSPSDVVERPDVNPAEVTTLVGAEQVNQLGSALCAEPVFDWPLDERWFKDNFCRANFQYCDTLDASHRAGTQHKHAEVHYFSQSLCSNSSFTFSQRYATACDPFGCTRRTWQISAGPMPPRIVYHEYWTGPKGADGKYRQWTATITSDQGNYVGLSYFGYTT